MMERAGLSAAQRTPPAKRGIFAMARGSAARHIAAGALAVGAVVLAGTAAAQSARETSDIVGIRIESNGALITGPMNARRTYIPLDRVLVPDAMRGNWARTLAECAAPSAWTEVAGQVAGPNNFRITGSGIIAKQNLRVEQTFVLPPDSVTLAQLQSGRPMVLAARKHRKADQILVIFSNREGLRDYAVLTLAADKQNIVIQTHRSREAGVRCGG